MGWYEVDGKIISTRRDLNENIRKDCASCLGFRDDEVGLMVTLLDRHLSAQQYVAVIREKNEEYFRRAKEREDEEYFEEEEESDFEEEEESDFEDGYRRIETVYVTYDRKVVAQNVKFIETYSIPVPDYIKNDTECKKQIRKTTKDYVIYDNVNHKRLFGDTLDECIEYAIEQVKDNESTASIIHIINRRYSKCMLITAVNVRIAGDTYQNIPKKQYVEDLYEFEYSGGVHR